MTTSNVLDFTGEVKISPLSAGYRLGEFELKEVVGEGGFGVVYRAYDHSLHREVAIKEYMPAMLAKRNHEHRVAVRSKRFTDAFDAGMRGFIHEARTLAQFSHPALIRIHRFWEENSTAYMAMELYKGCTLKQLLEEQSPERPSEAWLTTMLGPLLGALETLHTHQCFHRDIAPDNIFIAQPGDQPVLLDFGAARKSIADMADQVTVMVKSGYSPIEQYGDDQNHAQGAWTDLYALGAVLYFAVTGEAPPSAVVRSVHDSYAPLAESGRADLSERFCTTVDRALSVHAKDRWQDVAAFAQALGLVKAGEVYVRGEDAAHATPRPAPAEVSVSADEKGAAAVAVATVATDVCAEPMVERTDDGPMDAAEAVEAPAEQATEPKPQAPAKDAVEVATDATDAASDKDVMEATAAAIVQPQTMLAAEEAGSASRWWLPATVLCIIGAGMLWTVLKPSEAPTVGEQAQVALSSRAETSPPMLGAHEPGALVPLEAQPVGEGHPEDANTAVEPANVATEEPSLSSTPSNGTPAGSATEATAALPEPHVVPVYPRSGPPARTRPPLQGTAQQPSMAMQPPTVAAQETPRSASEAADGRVMLNIRPWGEVFVDGSSRGVTPPMKVLTLAPGTYSIEVRNGDLRPVKRRILVRAGKTTSITGEFRDDD